MQIVNVPLRDSPPNPKECSTECIWSVKKSENSQAKVSNDLKWDNKLPNLQTNAVWIGENRLILYFEKLGGKIVKCSNYFEVRTLMKNHFFSKFGPNN